MSDLSCQIKIEFDFMGEVEKCNLLINYAGNEERVDGRVSDFFCEAYEAGMIRYRKMTKDYFAKEKEKEERAELARLKNKYEVDQ